MGGPDVIGRREGDEWMRRMGMRGRELSRSVDTRFHRRHIGRLLTPHVQLTQRYTKCHGGAGRHRTKRGRRMDAPNGDAGEGAESQCRHSFSSSPHWPPSHSPRAANTALYEMSWGGRTSSDEERETNGCAEWGCGGGS